jgi:hypothetical protein
MDHFAGLDVSVKDTSVCIVDGTGKIVREASSGRLPAIQRSIAPNITKLVKHVGIDSIELRNSVVIEVHTNSYRSVRGRSLLCVICDEVAFWRSEDSAVPFTTRTSGSLRP